MGDRLVRSGFVDSESVCALSDWAHRLYSNLLVESDAAGRYDGRLAFMRAHLFPLGTAHRSEDFTEALDELEHPGKPAGTLPALIERYEFDGKPYIQLRKVACQGSTVNALYPWKDGTYRIEFVLIGSRAKDLTKFVKTSLPDGVGTPYVPPREGVSPPLQGKGRGKGSGQGKGEGAPLKAPPSESQSDDPVHQILIETGLAIYGNDRVKGRIGRMIEARGTKTVLFEIKKSLEHHGGEKAIVDAANRIFAKKNGTHGDGAERAPSRIKVGKTHS